MLMIWSSRARNRSADPVVSCFFGRIAPSDARPNHASRFEGIAKTNLQASRASDTEILQSQVNKAAKKRLSLNGLEILHGRLRSEPIVCTPEDAFRCFMGTELDLLVVGNSVLHKPNQDPTLKVAYKDRIRHDFHGIRFDVIF